MKKNDSKLNAYRPNEFEKNSCRKIRLTCALATPTARRGLPDLPIVNFARAQTFLTLHNRIKYVPGPDSFHWDLIYT